jgi:glycosyltransferase involved in cell wall biosynthesis
VPFIADIAVRVAGSTPTVLTYHSGSMKKGKALLDILIDVYEKTVLRGTFARASRIVAVSPSFANTALLRFASKTSVIPPAIDTGRFRRSPLPTGAPVVTFVGRIERSSSWKGIVPLLYSFKALRSRIPSATLELIGGGDAIEDHRALARELDIDDAVRTPGALIGGDLVDAYARSSLVVLPSTSEAESFGMVLAEAMASGRPVIGSNIGGIPQVFVDGESGILVPPGDIDALSAAMIRILTDRERAERLATAAHERAQRFSLVTQLERYRALFDDAISGLPEIVHITAYYPPHLGGLERVVQMCAEGLVRDGRDVEVVTTTASGIPPGVLRVQGVRIEALRSFTIANVTIASGFVRCMWRIPKNAIIHLHLAHAFFPEIVLVFSLVRRLKYVAHFHLDVDASGVFGWLFLLYKWVVWGPFLRRAQRVVACSREMKQIVIDKYHVDQQRVVVIDNAVGEGFFSSVPRRAVHQPLRVLSIGRLASQKRLERLITAMAGMEIPASLTIAGDGEDRETLESMVRRLGLRNVTFVGKKGDSEMQELHRTHDVFAIVSDREGMPLAVLEAMASGLPVVATDVEGLRDLVGDTGLLIDVSDVGGIARALRRIAVEPGLIERLSLRSIAKARKYDWKRFLSELNRVYAELI